MSTCSVTQDISLISALAWDENRGRTKRLFEGGQDEGKRLCFLGSGEVNCMECDGRTSEILSLHPSSKYELQR